MVNATNEHKQSVKRSLNDRCLPVGGSKGGARDATLPPFNFLQFSCSFRQKKCSKIIGFWPKSGLTPPPKSGTSWTHHWFTNCAFGSSPHRPILFHFNITMKQRKLSKLDGTPSLSPLDPPPPPHFYVGWAQTWSEKYISHCSLYLFGRKWAVPRRSVVDSCGCTSERQTQGHRFENVCRGHHICSLWSLELNTKKRNHKNCENEVS